MITNPAEMSKKIDEIEMRIDLLMDALAMDYKLKCSELEELDEGYIQGIKVQLDALRHIETMVIKAKA